VFPGFLDLVHLYGQKTDEVNEDFAVYRQYITRGLGQGENKAPSIEALGLFYLCALVLEYILTFVDDRGMLQLEVCSTAKRPRLFWDHLDYAKDRHVCKISTCQEEYYLDTNTSFG
jgi:hypothetical protein